MTVTNPCIGFINQCSDQSIQECCVIHQCSLTQMCEYALCCHHDSNATSVHLYGTHISVLSLDMCMCATNAFIHTSAFDCCDFDHINQPGSCCCATTPCMSSTSIHAQFQIPMSPGAANMATQCSSWCFQKSLKYYG